MVGFNLDLYFNGRIHFILCYFRKNIGPTLADIEHKGSRDVFFKFEWVDSRPKLFGNGNFLYCYVVVDYLLCDDASNDID